MFLHFIYSSLLADYTTQLWLTKTPNVPLSFGVAVKVVFPDEKNFLQNAPLQLKTLAPKIHNCKLILYQLLPHENAGATSSNPSAEGHRQVPISFVTYFPPAREKTVLFEVISNISSMQPICGRTMQNFFSSVIY